MKNPECKFLVAAPKPNVMWLTVIHNIEKQQTLQQWLSKWSTRYQSGCKLLSANQLINQSSQPEKKYPQLKLSTLRFVHYHEDLGQICFLQLDCILVANLSTDGTKESHWRVQLTLSVSCTLFSLFINVTLRAFFFFALINSWKLSSDMKEGEKQTRGTTRSWTGDVPSFYQDTHSYFINDVLVR